MAQENGYSKIVYSFVVADLFHYGHLQLLLTAQSLGDYHICGILSDEAAASYRSRPIANFDERLAVISNIRCVDRVMAQTTKSPEDNLKRIHQEFPDAELILVHGNDWQNIPGRKFVESIGGRIIQPTYYKRLSDSRIKQSMSKENAHRFESFTEHFTVKDIHYFTKDEKTVTISTKGNTLKSLQPLLTQSRIEPTFIFRVDDWRTRSNEIMKEIKNRFFRKVVVRSSAVNEDAYYSSKAGYYISLLDIRPRRKNELQHAVEKVIASYADKGNENELNQVLVQSQTENVRASGVVFTRNNQTGGPYYVINYDDRSGRTDTVTSGERSATFEIAHCLETERCPKEWRRLVGAVREIEKIIPRIPLDIEFAVDRSENIIIFQVRPLVIRQSQEIKTSAVKSLLENQRRKWETLSKPTPEEGGKWNIFSDMAFWNPSEIIGRRPSPLAFSLYRFLITDGAWNRALLPLGYSRVPRSRLMVSFAGKPYIDVRKSFNALLPASLQKSLREKLIHYFLDKLKDHPELHDKVEFDVLETCYVFGMPQRLRILFQAGFSRKEVQQFEESLRLITSRVVADSPRLIEADRGIIKAMGDRREARKMELSNSSLSISKRLESAFELLNEARNKGVIPFTRLARMAFMSKALLSSLVDEGWIDALGYERYFDSLKTVAKHLGEDFKRCLKGEMSRAKFLKKYGHLRPGTYDITSPRYDQNPDLFAGDNQSLMASEAFKEKGWSFAPAVMAKIDTDLSRCHLGFDSRQLLVFVRESLEGREAFKFEFTKNLSDALEHIALAGKALGFSREEMACLDVNDLKRALHRPSQNSIGKRWRALIKARQREVGLNGSISLPPILFLKEDFYVINHIRSKPNFVTSKVVEGPLVELLTKDSSDWEHLAGKLVMIENADPGYDWIFTKNIQGLITRYGGVASHMAIRCAEFGLPAAIGCGDLLYEEIKSAHRVSLNCGEGQIIPLH